MKHYPNAEAFINELESNMRKQKAKRIVAKRAGKKWTVKATAKRQRLKKLLKKKAPWEQDPPAVEAVNYKTDSDKLEIAETEEVVAATWLAFYRVEQAGLYVMRNTEYFIVRVVKLDDGIGVSKQVYLANNSSQMVLPMVSANSTFQKIKE